MVYIWLSNSILPANKRLPYDKISLNPYIPWHQISTQQCYFLITKIPKKNNQTTNLSSLTDHQLTKISKILDGRLYHQQTEYLSQNSPLSINYSVSIVNNSKYFISIPRKGLCSPWSSKATDILYLSNVFTKNKTNYRIETGIIYEDFSLELLSNANNQKKIKTKGLYDPMTQCLVTSLKQAKEILSNSNAKNSSSNIQNFISIKPLANCEKPLANFNDYLNQNNQFKSQLQSLTKSDLHRLYNYCKDQSHFLTDVELSMFAELNSEHCRHHVFKSKFKLKNTPILCSPMEMIKQTTKHSPHGIITAYNDNSSVLSGFFCNDFFIDLNNNNQYSTQNIKLDIVIKVETHNHPTAISPYQGAATGVGGQIRDELATHRGAISLAGSCGYMVADLQFRSFTENLNPNLYPDCYQSKAIDNDTNPLNADDFTPNNIATPLQIMIEAPLGASRYGNEYGRPLINGFFRTYEWHKGIEPPNPTNYLISSFHKPIMLCGGMGQVSSYHKTKKTLAKDDLIVLIGGPSMKIGLGGSSQSSSSTNIDQDLQLAFNSVQRENPEMQRRAFSVIENLAKNHQKPLDNFTNQNNPNNKSEFLNIILSIHDLGAGGLANAIPELVNQDDLGAFIELNDIPIADHTMNAQQIWCNESQERFVLVIKHHHLDLLKEICSKEKCPMSVIGSVTDNRLIVVYDRKNNSYPVKIPMDILFAKNSEAIIDITIPSSDLSPTSNNSKDHLVDNKDNKPKPFFLNKNFDIIQVCQKILSTPVVADKSFLINIADRSVQGLTYLDQMISAYNIAVGDAGVTLMSYDQYHGQAISSGERANIADLDHKLGSRLAASEAITNILCCDLEKLSDIKFSANWQLDFSIKQDRYKLHQAVQSLMDFCLELGIAIPVGKDSLSMGLSWKSKTINNNTYTNKTDKLSIKASSPLTLVITAFSKIKDVRNTLTPELVLNKDSFLLWINLSFKLPSLNASSAYYAYNHYIDDDRLIDISADSIKSLFGFLQYLRAKNQIYSYHDCSDGGLWASLCEMSFTVNSGLDIDLTKIIEAYYDQFTKADSTDAGKEILSRTLFGEHPGVVIQLDHQIKDQIHQLLKTYNLNGFIISTVLKDSPTKQNITIKTDKSNQFSIPVDQLKESWCYVSYKIQSLRDNPDCALEEYKYKSSAHNNALFYSASDSSSDNNISTDLDKASDLYPPKNPIDNINLCSDLKPKIAIIREQGINGHREMAYNFYLGGFDCYDLTIKELIDGEKDLNHFNALVFCGGFSYGDVLGAGKGWGQIILNNSILTQAFINFWKNPNTLTLGVCNGCQMLSSIKHLIPGAINWPDFITNKSRQFESRRVMVIIENSCSVWLKELIGYKLPVVVAHGQGRASFNHHPDQDHSNLNISLKYIDSKGELAESYPVNPSGSQFSAAGVCSDDGRSLIMMPHPERSTKWHQLGFHRSDHLHKLNPQNNEYSPWIKLFTGAKKWLDQRYKKV